MNYSLYKNQDIHTMKHNNKGIIFALITIAIILLFIANLFVGSLSIPVSETINILLGENGSRDSYTYIILNSRLPSAITALLCGASLAVSGLMLQTVFNNPLAGPSILGINSGANLGVAIVMLAGGSNFITSFFTNNASLSEISTSFLILSAAFIGSILVMGIILLFSTIIKSNLMLLIVGIMIGNITSSAISLFNFFSTEEGVHNFVIWGMGNFTGVSLEKLPLFSILSLIGLGISVLLIKPLNALLLGTQYAENLGINIKRTRNTLLLATGLLTAITTAYCGPIAFIGLAIPHVARLILGSDNHNQLLPLTILCGSATALLCNIITTLPGEAGIIPLNAITPIIGAPVIIYVILNKRIHKV